MATTLGCIAFALFFLSDYNDIRLHSKALSGAFPIGFVLLAVSVLLQLSFTEAPITSRGWRAVFLLALIGFAALEVYTLFFAFSAEEAYASPGQKRPVYTGGVYALCRHPGVWWLFFMLVCLWLSLGFKFQSVVLYTILNILLVTLEDRLVFPQVLTGYETYKSQTPFLFPNTSSIHAFYHRKHRD